MTTVTVNTAKPYDIHIGSGILNELSDEIRKLKTVRKICIVSDDTVYPLYGDRVKEILQKSDMEVIEIGRAIM